MVFTARSTEGQDYMVNKVQNPGKQIICKLATHAIGINDIPIMIRLLRDLAALPEPSEDGMDNNSRILLSIRDDFLQRLKLIPHYKVIFRFVFNFVLHIYKYIIHKQHSDATYRDWLSWFIAECVKRGWDFAGIDDPPSTLWVNEPPKIREKLISNIRSHYEVLQGKLRDSKNEGQREKVVNQFFNRILDSVNSEVRIWR